MKNILILLFIATTLNPQSYSPSIEDYKIVMPLDEVVEYSPLTDEDYLFDLIYTLTLSYEKYEANDYEDHGRTGSGWGTAGGKGKMTVRRANNLAKAALLKRIAFIKGEYPNISLFKQYIMAEVHYNLTHDRWRQSLRNKVRTNDAATIASSLRHYNKASGERLDGLVERRLTEIEYLCAEGNYNRLEELRQAALTKIYKVNGDIDIYHF